MIGPIKIPIDIDAQRQIYAGGVVSFDYKRSIDNVARGLKNGRIYTKFLSVYCFVGGTAAAHKLNLKNPRDSDIVYRIAFNGTFTHNYKGISPGGATADFADTKLNGSTVLNKNDSHWSFYSRTNTNTASSDYGNTNVSSVEVMTRFTDGNLYHDIPHVGDRFSFANANSLGMYTGSLGAANVIVYKNGVQAAAKGSQAANVYTNNNMLFCSGSSGTGTLDRPSLRNLSFGSIGLNLTAAEAFILYQVVKASQIILTRQV